MYDQTIARVLMITRLPHLWMRQRTPPAVALPLCQTWSGGWAEGFGGLLLCSCLTPWQSSGSVVPAQTKVIEGEQQRQVFSGHQICTFVRGAGTKEWQNNRNYLHTSPAKGWNKRTRRSVGWNGLQRICSVSHNDNAASLHALQCDKDENSGLIWCCWQTKHTREHDPNVLRIQPTSNNG